MWFIPIFYSGIICPAVVLPGESSNTRFHIDKNYYISICSWYIGELYQGVILLEVVDLLRTPNLE